MRHIFKIYLLVVTLLILTGCLKDSSACNEIHHLPEATQEGLNTLGFLKNGDVWVNFGRIIALYSAPARECEEIDARYFSSGDNQRLNIESCRVISCEKAYHTRSDLRITINTADLQEKVYFLDGDQPGQFWYYDRREGIIYLNDTINPFKIEITKFDTNERIVSGIFNGTLYNENDNTDSLRIIGGRFDANYLIFN